MLKQGRDLVVVAKEEEVTGYRLSTGMERSFWVPKTREASISSIGCCPSDRFVLIGYTNGSISIVYPDTSEMPLHKQEEAFTLSLRATCFWVTEDILYVSSENGSIRIYAIQPAEEKEEKKEEDSLGNTGSGWMDPIESFRREETEETETLSPRREESKFSFKYIKEMRHTTPIEEIAVSGRSIYLLDMRKRVKILNTKVVYDTLSILLFKRYLFCAEENTLFVEAGKTLISFYFSSEKIEAIRCSRLGKYLFLLTQTGIEIISIEKKEGRLLQRVERDKNLLDIAVDSDRSILYGVFPHRVSRLSISSIWIDKEPEDLQVNESSMQKKYVEEEEEEERYYEVPLPKSTRNFPLPPSRIEEIPEDDEITDLFEEELSDAEEKGSAKISRGEEKETGEERREEAQQNGVFGSIFLTEGRSTLAFWSPTCKVLASPLGAGNRVEVTLRGKTQRILEADEGIQAIELVACSEEMLLVYGEDSLHIYPIEDSSFGKMIKYLPKRKIKRLSCGRGYFSLVSEEEALDALEIYSSAPGNQEIFCVSEKIKGLFSSGEYTLYVTQEERISLIRVSAEKCEVLFSLLSPVTSTGCFVDAFGVSLICANKRFYAAGKNGIFPVSCEVQGVPVGISMDYLAYIPRTEKGELSLFPENISYAKMLREASIGKEKKEIHKRISEEVARTATHRADSRKENDQKRGDQIRGEQMMDSQLMDSQPMNMFYVERKQSNNEAEKEATGKKEEENPLKERIITTPTKKVKLLNPFSKSKKDFY